MKKLITLTCLSFLLLLSGCVEMNVTLDVSKTGNMNATYELLMDESVSKLANIDLTDTSQFDLKENFDEVKPIKKDGKSGVIGTKQLGNVLSKKSQLKNDQFTKNITIKEEKSFFYSIYKVSIDTSSTIEEFTGDQAIPVSLYGNQIKINATLNLPIELLESNATISNVNDSIKSYTWNMTLAKKEPLTATAKIYNIKNILLVTGITLLVLIAFFFIMFRKKRK